MSETLVRLSKGVDCNPRSIKRLVNVLQIISEIGEIKPAEYSRDSIDKWLGGQPWTDFSPKIVAWVLLAQNFPFRLSTLVQILLDFEQKKTFNERATLQPSNRPTFKYQSWQRFGGEKVAAGDVPECLEWTNFDDMLIFDFYQMYVEKFIHALGRYEMLSRLDHDPEEFAYLLEESALLKVKCKHVLGPKLNNWDGTEHESNSRNRDFSLLAYSFNLDPAMRLEVCI